MGIIHLVCGKWDILAQRILNSKLICYEKGVGEFCRFRFVALRKASQPASKPAIACTLLKGSIRSTFAGTHITIVCNSPLFIKQNKKTKHSNQQQNELGMHCISNSLLVQLNSTRFFISRWTFFCCMRPIARLHPFLLLPLCYSWCNDTLNGRNRE